MKRIINVEVGGKSFIITEEASEKLKNYLKSFESMLSLEKGKSEVMDDLEERIAELFNDSASGPHDVVDTSLVRRVIMQLGMPDGSTPLPDGGGEGSTSGASSDGSADNSAPGGSNTLRDFFKSRRIYRDPEGKKLGGVCSGLALYFDVDVTLIRIITFVLICCYGVGLGCYILIWILVPNAVTPAQKCELRGIPATAANMYKFSKK